MQTNLFKPKLVLSNLPPLIPLEFLAVARREKMSELISACDGEVFKHVWDIGTRTEHPAARPRKRELRRELRVFFLDVEAILNDMPIPELKHDACMDLFIPKSRGLKGTELQTHFTCGPDLIHDLESAGLLQVERERTVPVGPRSSKLYTRESVIAFLKSRFIGDCRKN